MITITLNKIKDNSPCNNVWEKILKYNKHIGMDTEFPLVSVLDSNDLEDTLWCLSCLPEHHHLWRKYAVWCARQITHLMTNEKSICALDVAWRHSDKLATDKELAVAWSAAWDAMWATVGFVPRAAATAAAWSAEKDAALAAFVAARTAAGAAAWDVPKDAATAAAKDAQRKKLTEILTASQWVDDVLPEGVERG